MVCVLLVIFDAGEQRLQPAYCAFTVSIQEGYDLGHGEKALDKSTSVNTTWGAGHWVVDVTYVHMHTRTHTHLASGE